MSLESIFVNEVMKWQSWRVGSSWKWTGSSHVNVLEMASVLQAIKAAARRSGGRVCLLVVVRSVAKGRSSSKALVSLLCKITAVSLAFGIFISILFIPTRLNVADDPARSVPVRNPQSGRSFLSDLDPDGLFKLAELPRMKHWISTWTSLFLGICSHNSMRHAALSIDNPRCRSSLPPVDFYQHPMDFDATLGYPCEGPPMILAPRIFSLVFVLCVVVSHGMFPRHRDDQRRPTLRGEKHLFAGRPVMALTRTNREKLLFPTCQVRVVRFYVS